MTITGIYDILGLEDLFSKKETWQTSVVCISQTAQAFFIKRDDFYHLQSVDCFDENMLQHMTLAKEFKKTRIKHTKSVLKSVLNSANISPRRDFENSLIYDSKKDHLTLHSGGLSFKHD